MKQIQTVEGNISGENVMKIKQQEVIKEKSQYDKIKASIEEKQRKLKKVKAFIFSLLISNFNSLKLLSKKPLMQSNNNNSLKNTSRKKKNQNMPILSSVKCWNSADKCSLRFKNGTASS